MGTQRLYYTDSYVTTFDAHVIRTEAEGTIAHFDATAFYPASGGQPSDRGWCNNIEVTDVIDQGDTIAHCLAAPVSVGPAHCTVDWRRRYDHMQQHTGRHVLSTVFVELFGFETLSFHLGVEVSTIELSTAELTAAQREQAEERAAELIGEARPVRISFVDSKSADGLRKASERSGELRVIEIEGIDRSACGGTHVRSTAELGLVMMRNQEKVRGHIRVEFVCGGRCLARARNDFQAVSQMARFAGIPVDSLPEHFQMMRERLAEAEKESSQLKMESARKEGRARWESAAPDRDGNRKVVVATAALDERARSFAQGFVENGHAALLLVSKDPPSVLLAVTKDSGCDAGAALKSAVQKFSGRGGARPQWLRAPFRANRI